MAGKSSKSEPDFVVVTSTGVWMIDAKRSEPYSEKEIQVISETYLASIQHAAEEKGLSHNELAKLTKIPQTTISRFLRGGASMRFDAVVVLMASLGLEIRPAVKKRKATKRRTKPNV